MLMDYAFTLDSVFNSVLPKTQNQPDKLANVLLSCVNETVFAWIPAFLQDLCHFMAWDNSSCASIISKCML